LRNGTKTSDAKFIKYYLNLFLEWSSYEHCQENKVGIKSAQSLTVSWALGKHNFFFGKNDWPNKAQNVLFYIWLLSFVPNPDLTLCYQIQACADLYPNLQPIQGLQGPRASLDTVTKRKTLCSCWESNPSHSVHGLAL
jgi:hypothetical protein